MPINFNGKLLPNDQLILGANNRSFRYGDGLFETIRVFHGEMPFFSYHWDRMTKGFECLGYEMPSHFLPDFFKNEMAKLTNRQGNWRIRLSFWRSGDGLYTPESNQVEFLIEASQLINGEFHPSSHGLSIGYYPTPIIPVHKGPALQYFNFKVTASLPYVLASNFKKNNGLDDCLLLNSQERVACATSSNVFLVKNGALLTPTLAEGCVAGTMRAIVLDIAKDKQLAVIEQPLDAHDLESAEEVFLTNAILGIRWVQKIEGIERSMDNSMALRLIESLNDKIAL